jgi:hypothetical protein
MIRVAGAVALCLCLSACAAPDQPYADDSSLAAVAYRHPGPPSLTLYTMISNRDGSGGHTALMINASQRVMFDPAGSFYLSQVPERNDVLYGITPAIEQGYRSAHARSTFHVLVQSLEVTPEQAELALRLAEQAGPVAPVFCASATANLLSEIPGLASVGSTMFPVELAGRFEALPGVVSERYYEDDSPDLDAALAANNAAVSAQQE